MYQRTKLLTGTIIAALALVIGMMIFAGLPIFAASEAAFVVDEAGDAGDGTCSEESCTLRDAILAANSSEGADTITFNLPLTQTIILGGSQLPVITDSLTILGSGVNDTVISANNASRVFSIGSGATVSIQDVTLRDADNLGDNGGAILNSGTLLIQNTRIISNSADNGAAIYSEGASLTVVHSELSENYAEFFGGAVDLGTSGNVTITDSIIRDNTSLSNGGALHQVGGTLTVLASTIQGNSGSIGGGFSNGGGTLVVRNSTIVSNTSITYGGGFYIDATSVVTINNSTISDNAAVPSQGGGIYSDSENPDLYLSNVIVANSIGGDCFAEGASLLVNLNNLVEDGGCNATFSGEPVLTGLGWYGGDTPTMMPYPGSPAIDQGDSGSCESVDQRGTARPKDGDGVGDAICDIGAVEAPFNPTITVNQITDIDDGVCDLSHCTLREAINAAAVATGAQTIAFDLPDESTITLGGSQLPVITDSLMIDGGTAVSLTVSADDASRIFEINSGSIVTITGMTIANGNTSGGSVCPTYCGGAIFNAGQLSVNQLVIVNSESGVGGAIYNSGGGSLRVKLSSFMNNSAIWGGAIFHGSGNSIVVDRSDFINNDASSFGGGLYFSTGTLEILSSNLMTNTAGFNGGAIYKSSGMLTVDKSVFLSNSALSYGGGIDNRDGDVTLTENAFSRNESGRGGGIRNDDTGTIVSNGNTIFSNTATVNGAGIYNAGQLSMNQDELAVNEADLNGGALYVSPEGVVTATMVYLHENSAATGGGLANYGSVSLMNQNIYSNTANAGGAVYNASGSSMASMENAFSGNQAASLGGAIYNFGESSFVGDSLSGNSSNIAGAIYNGSSGKMTFTDVTINSNIANSSGGGIYSGGDFTVIRSTIMANQALSDWGGAIYVLSSGHMTMTNSTVAANVAGAVGGGLANSGISSINNSTFNDNAAVTGGGLYLHTGSQLDLGNSIVANSSSGLDCVIFGTFLNNSHNLISDGTCSPDFSGDPKLGPLADNGGATLTHAITSLDSGAINNGDPNSCEATDQRGVSRPQGTACDIGAYELEVEFNLFLPFVVK